MTAVEDINLAVGPTGLVSLVGPSGCGKSTILGMVSGLLPLSGRAIQVEGHPVAGINPVLGHPYQRDALFPRKTVLDNVALPLLSRKVPRPEALRRARKGIERAGLAGFGAFHPHRLSGGMRKRLSLAMTMVGVRPRHHPHG